MTLVIKKGRHAYLKLCIETYHNLDRNDHFRLKPSTFGLNRYQTICYQNVLPKM